MYISKSRRLTWSMKWLLHRSGTADSEKAALLDIKGLGKEICTATHPRHSHQSLRRRLLFFVRALRGLWDLLRISWSGDEMRVGDELAREIGTGNLVEIETLESGDREKFMEISKR